MRSPSGIYTASRIENMVQLRKNNTYFATNLFLNNCQKTVILGLLSVKYPYFDNLSSFSKSSQIKIAQYILIQIFWVDFNIDCALNFLVLAIVLRLVSSSDRPYKRSVMQLLECNLTLLRDFLLIPFLAGALPAFIISFTFS